MTDARTDRADDALWDERRARAKAWFDDLRDRICAAFEALEDQGGAIASDGSDDPATRDLPPGRFERSATRRGGPDAEEDLGGGLMSVMRGGRVFEKVGVNVSAVYGDLAPVAQKALTARKEIPGLAEDPRFWAAGISLVAHLRNPRAPAAHMNTRFFWTPHASWFGGGADVNPTLAKDDLAYAEDSEAFHAGLREACDRHAAEYYPRFKAWADEYFLIKHRHEARGAGGVFYDDLDSGDWEADFAFTRDIGQAFLDVYPPILARRMVEPWTADERAHQLFRRGRYAEFNLVYDRGTQFGLATGHNADAVLMSLPPVATWP